MESCLYQGHVRHRRFLPVSHEFRYSIAYLYVDLAEWDEVVRRLPLMSHRRRWAVSSLRREDHLGDPELSLDRAVRDEVARQTGQAPRGPIRMLSQWRSFGYFFSPVNFFFCFAPDGCEVTAVVAEVNNTPWGEQHCYVLWDGNRIDRAVSSDSKLGYGCEKVFHVSPFLGLDLEYRWNLTAPGPSLTIHIQALRGEQQELDSTLTMRQRPLSRRVWLSTLARYPLVPPRILAGVHFEALRLWIKKVPFYPHPSKWTPVPASNPPHDKSLQAANLPAGRAGISAGSGNAANATAIPNPHPSRGNTLKG